MSDDDELEARLTMSLLDALVNGPRNVIAELIDEKAQAAKAAVAKWLSVQLWKGEGDDHGGISP